MKKDVLKLIVTILSWLAVLLLVLIGGLLIYYVINKQLHERRGETYEPPIRLYTIISGSMEPNLRIKDVVLITRVNNPTRINEGDIITFISTSALNPGMTVTHRVIERIDTGNGFEFRTKGDNNKTADASTVPFENVKGKVVLRIPRLGIIQSLLTRRLGWIFIIIIPAVAIILYDILKLLKIVGIKKKIDEDNKEPEPDLEKQENERQRKERLKIIYQDKLDNFKKDDKEG